MRETVLTYRLAVPEEIEILLGLMGDMHREDPWSVPFVEEEVRGTVAELLENPNLGKAFLIYRGEACIGYLVLSFDFSLEYGGKNAWIDELFILADFRGQGIGTRALDFAAQTALEFGAKVLHLEVNRGNPAINLYQRRGFEDHDRYLLSKWLDSSRT